MNPILARRRLLTLAALLVSALAFLGASQLKGALRYDLGSWDRAWLPDPTQVHPARNMDGPWRRADGTVEVIEFRARITRRQAVIALPYHALRSPLELRLRCHRFGLKGTAIVTVGNSFRDEVEYSERSYPWSILRLKITEETASEGPLRVGFDVVGGDAPPRRMPDDVGLGIDWIEVRPLSEDVWFLPAAREWLWLLLVLLLAIAVSLQLGLRPWVQGALVLGLGVAISVAAGLHPVMTSALLPYAWLPFPLIAYVVWIARLAARHPLGPDLGPRATMPSGSKQSPAIASSSIDSRRLAP